MPHSKLKAYKLQNSKGLKKKIVCVMSKLETGNHGSESWAFTFLQIRADVCGSDAGFTIVT